MLPSRSNYTLGVRYILIGVCSLLLVACSSSIAIEPEQQSKTTGQEPQIDVGDINSAFKGWDYLANKLIADGIPKNLVHTIFNSPDMPAISFVPFKLNPVETHQIYNTVTSAERLDRAESYLEKYKDEFKHVEIKFGVNRFVIAAIISVETNWGRVLGNERVFYRLSRIATTGEPKNLILNFRKLNLEDSSVSFEQTKARSEYLFKTFYPHLLALFHTYKNSPNDILNLKGSIAGAFGLPQFLPKSMLDYGTDGNNDKLVDLFCPEDAIYSVANFLKSNGWRRLLNPSEKIAVLWHYNRSEAYGRAIIRVALSLQNRVLKLGD